jgi:uncharacterized membrane protein
MAATPKTPANPVTDRLKGEVGNLAGALRDRAIQSVKQRAGEAVGRLSDYAEQGGGPGLMAAVTGTKNLAEGKSPARSMAGAGWAGLKGKLGDMFGGKGKGKGGKGQKIKVTNIVETIDVGVPVDVAYNQWTEFGEFPSFMKKVESVDQESDEKLNWRAQIFWSHRNWQATILRQTPDQEIIWRSEGDKGYVDGAVTFHALAPNLTRIVLVLEYFPKGFFEHTANLWRAQGRRARLELKHFRRYVMTNTILHPDEVEGWRGVIEDSEVVKDHETALREEQERDDNQEPDEELPEDEVSQDELPEDEEPEDEEPEDELPEDELPEDELAEDEEPEDEEPEDELPADEYEYEDEEDEEARGNGQRPRRRSQAAGQRRPSRPSRRRSPARS